MSASYLAAAELRAHDASCSRAGTPTTSHGPAAALLAQLRAALVLKLPRTWRLEVTSSSCVDAGQGVFLHGHCPEGTAVALYPGVAYLAEDLPVMHKLILPGNSYVLARRDGVLLDGNPSGTSRQILETAVQRDLKLRGGGQQQADVLQHELAVGNMINHPPSGMQPNVSVAPLDLWEADHADLISYIPTFNFRPPSGGGPSKQTAVLVAKRAIRDEELLLDYKLRLQGPLEEWYAPVAGASQAAETT